MAMRDNSDYVSAKLNTQEQEENIFHAQDPFNKTWDDLKDLGGINQNFKRRTVRLLNKAAEMTPAYLDSANAQSSGIDGTGTKGINPGTVYRNGYGLFDIITPPYNMYELANFYDTSFANHAAIDAKVENVVGLGYRFDISDRTSLRLETSSDEQASSRARKRIERMKIEYNHKVTRYKELLLEKKRRLLIRQKEDERRKEMLNVLDNIEKAVKLIGKSNKN